MDKFLSIAITLLLGAAILFVIISGSGDGVYGNLMSTVSRTVSNITH